MGYKILSMKDNLNSKITVVGFLNIIQVCLQICLQEEEVEWYMFSHHQW
jgi:hypothetical protein